MNAVAQSNNRTINSFLAAHPQYHMLTLADLPEWKDDQEYVAQFNPIARGDANGDGRADLVAIFVRRSDVKSFFSLICFHGVQRGFSTNPIWAIRDSEEPILNTKVLSDPRELVAWFCYHCDVATSFLWKRNRYVVKGGANDTEASIPDYQAYIGTDLNDLLREVPDIRRRLRKLLGRNYQLFMKNLSVSSNLQDEQGFLKMHGLAPHMGTVEEAVFLLSFTTGKLYCAILSERFGNKYKLFSEDPSSAPTAIIDRLIYR